MERITRSNAVQTASQGRNLVMKQEDCYADDYFALAIIVKLPEIKYLVDSLQLLVVRFAVSHSSFPQLSFSHT
jgi:hypothetical protein